MDLPLRFLLVDDSVGDQLLAAEAFQQLRPDCVLTCVSSGAEALEMLRSQKVRPDVVLLDVNMPGMNGLQVLEAIKADPRLALLPVVMLSTSNAENDVQAAYTLHANSYLVKAPIFEDFVAQIETFLDFWQKSRIAHP